MEHPVRKIYNEIMSKAGSLQTQLDDLAEKNNGQLDTIPEPLLIQLSTIIQYFKENFTDNALIKEIMHNNVLTVSELLEMLELTERLNSRVVEVLSSTLLSEMKCKSNIPS